MTTPIHLQARSRLAFLLAVPVLVSMVMYWVAGAATEGSEWVRHTLRVELSLQRALADLQNAASEQRGYLVSGEERFLDTYRAAALEARRELERLETLAVDSPSERAAIARIRPLMEARLQQLELTLGLYRSGGLNSAVFRDGIERGRQLMASIQSLANQIYTDEQSVLGTRERELAAEIQRFIWSLILGYGFIVLSVFSLYRDVRRYGQQTAEAEDRLMALNSELDERVRDRTAALRAREEKLRESEATTRALLETAAQAILAVDGDGKIVLANRMTGEMFGYEPSDLLGQAHEILLPERHRRHKAVHRAKFPATPNGRAMGQGMELVGMRRDGSEFPIEVSLSSVPSTRGQLSVSFISDITTRKQAETALRHSEQQLRELAGNLLTVQEDERRRVARELHDDVTQTLAFLSIELGKLAGELPDTIAAKRDRVRALQDQTLRASIEVRRLSHGLHPSVIEDFGLSIALEEFCEEFEKTQGVRVVFEGLGEDSRLHNEGAACLYRVAQESMRNAVQHGHASQISVALQAFAESLQLRVQDNGRGFSGMGARSKRGLGMVSMRERMRLVNGNLTITSVPEQGTEVTASVPLTEVGYEESAHSAG